MLIRQTPYQTLCLFFGLVLIGLVACTTAPPPCTDDSNCGDGERCLEGSCVLSAGVEAPPNLQCLINSDCPDQSRCVEGMCYENECVDGAEQTCETQCGMGTQLCVGGIWRACSAQPQNEICGTGEDEDCDGSSDEGCSGCSDGDVRTCTTQCGTGEERCLNGSFVGCDAPRPRIEICGDPNQMVDEDCDGMSDEGCADCENGDTRACQLGCDEMGTEVCEEKTWRNCNARAPKDELCNNVDDDCDGEIDEDIRRDCSNQCGPGLELCQAGMWVECSVSDQCDCVDNLEDQQVCGQCGVKDRVCAAGAWTAWSDCVEGGQCTPGEEQPTSCEIEGLNGQCGVKRRICDAICVWGDWTECLPVGNCAPGEVEEELCSGSCGGSRRRTCTELCEWGEWSACEGGTVEVACSPGETDQDRCELCGQRTRSCTDSCQWGSWSDCTGKGMCEAGERGYEACSEGLCASRERICNEQCQWEGFSECIEGGVCDPNQAPEEETCGRCGVRQRSCNDNCGWEDWSTCQEPSNACTPGDVQTAQCGETSLGACEIGEKRRTCNNSCQWGSWGSCTGYIGPTTEICGSGIDEDCNGISTVRPDQYEGTSGNNTCGQCYSISQQNAVLTLYATIDNVNDDWDFYCVQVVDGTSLFGDEIVVKLSNIPSGADYDVYLYKEFSGCNARDELAFSVNGSNLNEELRWGEHYASNDSGLYIIGVKQIGNQSYDCDHSYVLEIDLDI